MKGLLKYLFVLVLLGAPMGAGAQQITIPRVEQMPALPASYFVRDWKAVARGFDALVFDADRQGTYLPLVRLYENGPNYPALGGFGLHTYVGTRSPQGNEAITALPALVGATLVGLDKRDQFGQDWVLRAQQYFNNRPSENVYLNGPTATSGTDWWYDTMPNVFFYQLYSLYGSVGDFDRQFGLVADRWLEAIGAMGGSAAPWRVPQMNYRAFALSTMRPLASGVVEPEAAGALAWIEYMAYRQTGDERYRIGAEWAMEFLNSRTSNPSYELQLPYGALAAARMNAELGTRYDVAKLVNWAFEQGPLRGWGSVVGTWGGYDASGLIGETAGEDYAFVLNGFQQAAALVPLVRYDTRFARAIGRWMANLASASRLFYHPFLPDANQDGEAWAQQYDPDGYIAYEALRERGGTAAPFATGDAVRGGWAATNLSLYSSASVGYLAALVDTTSVPGVLRLDLRATDFFAPEGFPTYLYYNPHANAVRVALSLPEGTFDLYDAASDVFLQRGVSGTALLDLPPDAARVVVLTPAGGVAVEENGQLRVDGVVVDFAVGTPASRPRVKAFVADAQEIGRAQPVRLYCTGAGDGTLSYTFAASGGTLGSSGAVGATRVVTWQAAEAGTYAVVCGVTDGQQQQASDTLRLTVVSNFAPRVTAVTATPDLLMPGETATLTCSATDPEGDPITYAWAAEAGTLTASGAEAMWTAPDSSGYFAVRCTATDPEAASGSAEGYVTVGDLVLHLPLDGDAGDASPFGYDGEIVGPVAAPDRKGVMGGALAFDGVDDHVALATSGPLGFTGAVTLTLWMQPAALLDREQFLVSHGSWQHRWKLSITPDEKLRWTINTSGGITDLDAPEPVQPEAFRFVAATYDGAAMRLFVDGTLAATKAHTGLLGTTAHDLLVGQMLPGETAYNFQGVLDEVRLYNRALSADEIRALYDTYTPVEAGAAPLATSLGAPQPNPSASTVRLPFALTTGERVRIVLYDLLGRRVRVLWDAQTAVGAHVITWDGHAADGTPVGAGVYLVVLETPAGHLRQTLVRVP